MTTVYFGTNRNLTLKGKKATFGTEFSGMDMADLRFGKCEVDVPSKTVGHLQVYPEDLKVEPHVLGSVALLNELKESMGHDQRDTILYVHGFNVDFNDAIIAGARLSERYGTQSPPNRAAIAKNYNVFVFTWPSKGEMLRYRSDRQAASNSGHALWRACSKLVEFLKGIQRGDGCGQRLHLVAHSMGNYVLRQAIQGMIRFYGSRVLPRVFDHTLLFAADEDADAFEHDHKLRRLHQLTRYTTVYFNDGDLPLDISDQLKGYPDRLGDRGPTNPWAVPRDTTLVDATPVVTGNLEHDYYLTNDRVVADARAVLAGRHADTIPNRTPVANANHYRLDA
jgi:esterase/lipase superfamily enzyme